MTKSSTEISGGITRRQLAGVAAGSAALGLVVGTAIAQAPVTGQDRDPRLEDAARQSHRENSDALAKFDIPMSLEPAFQFKA
jgi:hypothetical protein